MVNIQKYSKGYHVHVYETGADGNATIHALFNYMQDAASEHAEILGFGRSDLMKNNHIWVLSRMYAEILELPVWQDKIIVTTWPSGLDKIFLTRNYRIETTDGKIIAKASSSWLIVDSETRHLIRSDHVVDYEELSFTEKDSPVRSPEKLVWDPKTFETMSSFRIRLSDLDVNLHTNNANYVKWINDTYGPDFIKKFRPKSLEINYLSESMFDDDIEIRNSNCQPNIYLHSIYRTKDNKEICRARFEWLKK